MKASRLSEADRRECDEDFQTCESRATSILPLQFRAGLFTAILLVSTGGEYCLTYSVVYDLIGPLPGELWSPVPAVIALSGLISVIAFALYKRIYPKSLPVRLVNSIAGYVALAFVLAMGLMLAKLIFESTDNGTASIQLFGEAQTSESASLLTRLFDFVHGPFALVFGFLTICNLYVAEYSLMRLREVLMELHELRSKLIQFRAAMNEVDNCERELARLEAERQSVLHGFEPSTAYAYAVELSSHIAEARSPMEQWITAQQIRKKPPESVFGVAGESDIDIPKLKERVSVLNLDAKVIYAAFRGEEKSK